MSKIEQHNVAIVGANGYSGRELVKLLLNHPAVAAVTCFSRDPNWRLSDECLIENEKKITYQPIPSLCSDAKNYHTVFLAVPTEVSLELVPQLINQKINIIDLSGAFRLDKETFEHWYQQPHTASDFLPKAIYGLQPWQNTIGESNLIANPGCYATAILMALLPLLKKQLIDENHIVIDAKSGISGAGKNVKSHPHFCEIADNCLPYKVGTHQHLPEIINYCQQFANATIHPMMTTHLLPVRRGIIAGIYCHFCPEYRLLNQSHQIELIRDAMTQVYKDYPLMKFSSLNNDNRDKKMLALTHVVGTSQNHIGFSVNHSQIYLFSTIDNLLKGAASQAIENFNAIIKLPCSTGLTQQECIL